MLTMMPKLPSPCRAELLEYLVPHTHQTPLHAEQTKKGGKAERERERGGGGRGDRGG